MLLAVLADGFTYHGNGIALIASGGAGNLAQRLARNRQQAVGCAPFAAAPLERTYARRQTFRQLRMELPRLKIEPRLAKRIFQHRLRHAVRASDDLQRHPRLDANRVS